MTNLQTTCYSARHRLPDSGVHGREASQMRYPCAQSRADQQAHVRPSRQGSIVSQAKVSRFAFRAASIGRCLFVALVLVALLAVPNGLTARASTGNPAGPASAVAPLTPPPCPIVSMTYVWGNVGPGTGGLNYGTLWLLPNYATSGNYCPETPAINAVVVPLGTSPSIACVWQRDFFDFDPMTYPSWGAPPSTNWQATDSCNTNSIPLLGNSASFFVNYEVQEYAPYGPVAGLAGEPTTPITGDCTITSAPPAGPWFGTC